MRVMLHSNQYNRFTKTRFYYDNVLDAYVPQLWAQEGLAILEENLVIGKLVHRDFSPQIAAYGDTVNTRKPGEFVAIRKTDADNVTVQNATATNIPVKLDQDLHVSFMLKDGEESKSFQELSQVYLRPAVFAIARAIDQIIAGQAIRFRRYSAGGLNTLTKTNAGDYLIDTRTRMNLNRVIDDDNRQLILTTVSEGILLKDTQFTDASRVGDNGTALREASLGRKFGYNIFMAQNTPYVRTGNTTVTGAINAAGGYQAGTSTFTVDGLAAAIAAGTWFTIAGDDTPLQVVSTVGAGTPTSITSYYPTTNPVTDNAIITLYTPGAVNNAGGYLAGYAKEITVDGFTVAPQVGQPITFGSDNADVYTIIAVNGLVGVTLDRPLAAGIADNATANIGPAGSYNFAFHRNAIAFVSRPLAIPREGMGVLSANIDFNDLSMRVSLTYDGRAQGTLVTIDMLAGVAQLEPLNGVLFLG
jgi:hypothetical protein